MASSLTAPTHPESFRSPDSAVVDLAHPTPDLQSLQGAYIGNVERLEEHAERMSESGSDLGEEIRKLQQELKMSDSRRSSLHSAPTAEDYTRPFTSRSRNASTSSYSNSIVDINVAARWGGYSPAGYVTSPGGSLASSSLSQPPSALQRQRSSSKASRLDQIMHAEDEEDDEQQRVLEQPGSPQSQRSVPLSIQPNHSPPLNRRSVSSFTREYDQIAQEIKDGIHEDAIHDDTRESQSLPVEHQAYADIPDRPPTAASTDTTHRMRTLWHDFDGTHCPDTVEEEPEPSHSGGSRESSMMKLAPDHEPQGAPPPDDGMVFYPAPVPRMLNLPKRLSKMPAANMQTRRRTQLLDSMQAENRKSAPWLSEMGGETSKPSAKSRQSLANLPPQLRASAYFDQPAPAQEFEVRGESAEDTLNNILEASAHAPVSAFTDHPFTGHVGDEVYGKEHKAHKRQTSKANEMEKLEQRKSRNSLNLLDTRRNSSGDLLNKLKKRNSSADLNMLTVRASESRMSLDDDLEQADQSNHEAKDPEFSNDDAPRAGSVDSEHHDDTADEEEDEEQEEEQLFGAPTTLLAELQMRKQQQKSRNLTAATAFPNGMHSTLLELDAVAEIEKKKRRGQKVNLAWEGAPPPVDEDDSDDDVPLGVLFPGRDGLINKKSGANTQHNTDWDRPIGLMAKRALEDSEPLSRRRTRLLGGNRVTRDLSPSKRNTQLASSQSQQHLAVPTTTTPQPESEEDEGETLAQRMRRMKDRQALDDAIGADVRKSIVSGEFAAEMLSQLGIDEDKSKPTAPPANGDEEETLGQRRARLQAEALARGDANPHGTRPPLRASMSMADILGAHPVNPTNQARKVSDEALLAALPPGSLLRQNAEKQERLKASRLDQNMRMSSFGSMGQPLLGEGVGRVSQDQPIAAKIQAYKNNMAGVPTPMTVPMSAPSMMFNGQMMPGMTPNAYSMNLTAQRESYFPQPNMGMSGMGMHNGITPNSFGYPPNNMNMMAPQMMAMNMGMMGMPMNGIQGMQYPQTGGMAGMQVHPSGMMMMEPPMDPRQRDMIDRWRESVMR